MINLKEMNNDQLETTAKEIREKIISVCSTNGGHLASNLGVVELTMAIHKSFNLPDDTLIFDVSHQCYTHKILSGREEEFDSLRTFNGLSGFTSPEESEYDAFTTGHSSTAVSLAIGRAISNQQAGIKNNVIAVVGDASSTNGLTLEALNFLGAHPELKVIIIINDNDMSVSKNVGALAKTFNKIRIKRKKGFIYKITPRCFHGFLDRMKDGLKHTVYKKSLFDSFNLKYFQGIDGHNFKELERYFNFAKKYPSSVVLHVKTIKGKGYSYAENDKIGNWHNAEPFDIESGVQKINDSQSVGEYLSDILVQEQNIGKHFKVITSAMTLGNGLSSFEVKYPTDLIDVGIAEENAVAIAAGMTSDYVLPIVFVYSTFLQRAYDEILNDVARANKHVVFCLDRSGIVAKDGSTHQGIFDLSYLTPIPNLTIFAPSTLNEAKLALEYAIDAKGPVAIRYPRYLPMGCEVDDKITNWVEELPISSVNVITYGADLEPLKEMLKNKGCGLINARCIKPLDHDMLDRLSTSSKLIVYEQVNDIANLDDFIVNYYQSKQLFVRTISISLHETFLKEGTVDELKEYANIGYKRILEELN